MIVNSSQGGGSKDTWVLDDGASVDLAPGTLPAAPAAAAARRALRRLARSVPAAAAATATPQAAPYACSPGSPTSCSGSGRDLTRAEHTARMLDGAFHADVAGAPGERGISLSWDGGAGDHRRQAADAGEDALEVAAERAGATARPSRDDAAAHARHRQPGVDRLVRRSRPRARTHAARRDLD